MVPGTTCDTVSGVRDVTTDADHARDQDQRSDDPTGRPPQPHGSSARTDWHPTLTVEARRRPWRLWAGLGGAVALLLAVGVAGALLLPGGTTLAGTRVAGAGDAPVALGEAQQALADVRLRFTTTVGTEATFTGADLGLDVDEARSAAEIGRGLPSLQVWAERITDGPVAVPFTTRPPAPDVLDDVAEAISRPPQPADVVVTAAGVEVADGADGVTVSTAAGDTAVEAAVRTIATTSPQDWPDVVDVDVAGQVEPPAVAQADIDAVTASLERFEAAEVTLVATPPTPPSEEDGGTAAADELTRTAITLTPRELRALVDVEPVDGAAPGERLTLVPDPRTPPPRIVALLDTAAIPPDVEATVVDRSPTPERGDDLTDVSEISGEVVVEGTRSGFEPDRPATIAGIVDAALAGGGEVSVAGTEAPDVEPAELGITAPVSTFTTFFTAGQSRNQNIARIAEIVDGTIIRPGESYELNHAVGRRTVDNGFTLGGAILDGELVSDVGGGVSQFATTFFNAAWFAGVELVDWKPHSFYFDRYPAGREATINYPNVNLEIRNDTPHAILVDTDTDATSVTVTFWSTPYWDVQTITGPCACGGSFSITVDRIRTAPGGSPIEESYTTTYTVPTSSR